MNNLNERKAKICPQLIFLFCWFLADDDLPEDNAEMISSNVARNEEGLILPKKLINPCLESTDRQNLHRELLFNQKM